MLPAGLVTDETIVSLRDPTRKRSQRPSTGLSNGGGYVPDKNVTPRAEISPNHDLQTIVPLTTVTFQGPMYHVSCASPNLRGAGRCDCYCSSHGLTILLRATKLPVSRFRMLQMNSPVSINRSKSMPVDNPIPCLPYRGLELDDLWGEEGWMRNMQHKESQRKSML